MMFMMAFARLLMTAACVASAGTAISAPASAAEAAKPAAIGRLSHHRQWFTDTHGRAVMLRGGNVYLSAQPADEGYFAWHPDTPRRMAEQGFNAVRLVVVFSRIMPEPGRVDEAYVARIAETVAAYRAAGVYALIDFHQDEYGAVVGLRGMPDWATFTGGISRIPSMNFPMGYFKDPAVQRAFDNFWANHPVPGTGMVPPWTSAV
jgi:endoglycosylceramidase